MNSWRIGPGEIQKVDMRIDAIYNGKKQSQWFVLQETEEGRVLFLVTQPTIEEAATLEKPEEHRSDLL